MRKFMTLMLGLLLTVSQLWAQNRTVTGKVVDEKGVPVSGASVVAQGAKTGAYTNADGSFSISVGSSVTTLVITSLNYKSENVSIAGKSSVTVNLQSEVNDLTEVVVQTPYGSTKKSSFTGSEGTISAKTIEKQQVTSVTRMIEGSIPGVSTTSGGGTPGGGAAIVIRGFSSITQAQGPLYVLNGVPYDGSISALSTDDIESLTVLKDAAATNLFGSRAANGVVMITTKKGKKGTPAIQASIKQGFSTRGIPEYNRVDTKQYYELFWEAFRNSYFYGSGQTMAQAGVNASNVLTSPTGLVYNAYNVPGNTLVDPVTGQLNPNASLLWNESWSEALFQTAQRTNANLSVSGSTDKSSYYISGGYLNEEGIAKFSGYKRYNFRADVRTQATEWLNTGLTFDGSTDTRKGLFAGGTATSNPFYYSRQMGPIYPVYQHNTTTGAIVLDANGQPALDFGTPAQMGTRPYAGNSNLLGTLALDVRQQKRLNGNINTYAEAKFLKDFTLKTALALNYFTIDGTTYQNSQYGDAAGVRGRATVSSSRQTSITANQVLSWAKTYSQHDVRVLAGHENYKFKTSQLSATKTGFGFPGQTALDNAAVVESPPSSSEDNETLESYFGNINYSYDSKYLLSGSLRRDGSSKFAPDVRWGTFYSVGAGWRISKENFMKNVSWVNELKLRGSYGEAGSNNVGGYYQFKDYYFADGLGNFSTPTTLANPSLKWESNVNLSYGLEFTLFKRRLSGTIELYDRRSKDLIFTVPIQPSAGVSGGTQQNIGESKNTGLEISLGYNVIRKRDFDWRVDANFFTFKNKVTQLPPTQKVAGIVNGTKKIVEGGSIYDFWLREFAGVDAATGLSAYYLDVLDATGKPTGVRNLTTDITKASFYFVGTAIPKYSGGITNSFRYKNVDLSILVSYSYGASFYDGNYAGIMHSGSAGTAWHTDILNRWQKPGDVTNVPRLQNATAQDGASSRFLFDASYINIKNITLTYSLPQTTAKKLHLNGMQFFGNVDNAYIFTAKKGGDPQQNFDGTVGAAYPAYRTVTVGLTVKL